VNRPSQGAAGARLSRQVRLQLDDYPADAAWSADGRSLLVAGGQGQLLLVDFSATTPAVQPLGSHAGGVLAVAWQAAGKLCASSGQDGKVLLWDSRTRSSQCIHEAAEWSEQLAFAAHGRLLAVGTGRQLRVFDSTGALRAQLPAHSGVIAALAWRPRSHELAALGNGGAHLHRFEPQLQSRVYAWTGACLTASWSADGRVLASGMQDGAVHFWNIAADTQSQMKGYGTKVALTSWSANSRYLATAADQQIVIWDFSGRGPEGTEPLQLSGHTARLTQLVFQPQGTLLATAARDRRLMLWRPAQGAEPRDADLLGDEVTLLRWSNDGRQLAAADRSGGLCVYALNASS
jgi:WD40 repeat protein